MVNKDQLVYELEFALWIMTGWPRKDIGSDVEIYYVTVWAQ